MVPRAAWTDRKDRRRGADTPARAAAFQRRIVCAFVYGSVARGQEHAISDSDVLVVGDVGLADLAPVLRKAERRLGREVSVTTFSAREFRKQISVKNHFLSEVVRSAKQFLKGNESHVDDLIGKPRTLNAIGRQS